MAAINTNTFLSETVLFLRDQLLANITDPISSSRVTSGPRASRFVMTSYPTRPTVYPIITIRNDGPTDIQRMGMRSELKWVSIPIEVRIWARNEKERDNLTEQTMNFLRTNQYGGNSTSADDKDLHDFTFLSAVPVDELGQEGVKSMVITVGYNFVLGS